MRVSGDGVPNWVRQFPLAGDTQLARTYAYDGLDRLVAANDPDRVHAYVLMTNHVHLLLTPDGVGRYRACCKRWGGATFAT